MDSVFKNFEPNILKHLWLLSYPNSHVVKDSVRWHFILWHLELLSVQRGSYFNSWNNFSQALTWTIFINALLPFPLLQVPALTFIFLHFYVRSVLETLVQLKVSPWIIFFIWPPPPPHTKKFLDLCNSTQFQMPWVSEKL